MHNEPYSVFEYENVFISGPACGDSPHSTSRSDGNPQFPNLFQVLFFFQPESCLEGKLMPLLDISELASRVNFNPIKGLGGRDLEILESIQACLVLA